MLAATTSPPRRMNQREGPMVLTPVEKSQILKTLECIPSLMAPEDTPFKPHSLPQTMKMQLFQQLLKDYPRWPHNSMETQRLFGRINREKYEPSYEEAGENELAEPSPLKGYGGGAKGGKKPAAARHITFKLENVDEQVNNAQASPVNTHLVDQNDVSLSSVSSLRSPQRTPNRKKALPDIPPSSSTSKVSKKRATQSAPPKKKTSFSDLLTPEYLAQDESTSTTNQPGVAVTSGIEELARPLLFGETAASKSSAAASSTAVPGSPANMMKTPSRQSVRITRNREKLIGPSSTDRSTRTANYASSSSSSSPKLAALNGPPALYNLRHARLIPVPQFTVGKSSGASSSKKSTSSSSKVKAATSLVATPTTPATSDAVSTIVSPTKRKAKDMVVPDKDFYNTQRKSTRHLH